MFIEVCGGMGISSVPECDCKECRDDCYVMCRVNCRYDCEGATWFIGMMGEAVSENFTVGMIWSLVQGN